MPMFGKFNSENFIKEICLYLEHVIFLPDSFIVIKGEIGEEMYFIAEGSVNVLAEDKKSVLKTLNKGDFFGEIAIFMNTTRTTFVKSVSYCSIFRLRKKYIDKILKSYSTIQDSFKKEAEARVE
jgi:CRP-like cAMP-binding protein